MHYYTARNRKNEATLANAPIARVNQPNDVVLFEDVPLKNDEYPMNAGLDLYVPL